MAARRKKLPSQSPAERVVRDEAFSQATACSNAARMAAESGRHAPFYVVQRFLSAWARMREQDRRAMSGEITAQLRACIARVRPAAVPAN